MGTESPYHFLYQQEGIVIQESKKYDLALIKGSFAHTKKLKIRKALVGNKSITFDYSPKMAC
jgi:hypothetical protein